MAETPQSVQIDNSCLDQGIESPITRQDTTTVMEPQQKILEIKYSSRLDLNHLTLTSNMSLHQTDWVTKIVYNLLCVDSTSTTPAQTPAHNLTDYTFNQSSKLEKKRKKSIIDIMKLFHNQQIMAMALERELTARGLLLSFNCTLLAATDLTRKKWEGIQSKAIMKLIQLAYDHHTPS